MTHWILLFAAISLIITPLGNIKSTTVRFHWPIWLLLILSVEVSLYALYYGFYQLTNPQSLSTNLTKNFGLFPWALYGLLAVNLSIFGYSQHKNGLLSVTLKPILNNTIEDNIGVYADTFVRIAITFSFISAISFTALNTALQLTQPFSYPLTTNNMLVGLGVIVLLNLLPLWPWLYRALSTIKVPLSLILFIALLLNIGLVLILNHVVTLINPLLPTSTTAIPFLSDSTHILLQQISLAWWWLAWAPLIGGFIAFVSQGYRLRSILLISLLPPVFLHYVFLYLQHHPIALLKWLMPLLGASFLFVLLVRANYIDYLMRGTLPGIHALKKRNPKKFILTIMQTSSLLLVIYWVMANVALAFMLFCEFLPLAILLLISCLAVYKTLIKKSSTVE